MADKEPHITRVIRKAARGLNNIADQLELALVRFRGEKATIDFNIDLAQETVWATQQCATRTTELALYLRKISRGAAPSQLGR